jgi:hypothetical protein
MTERLFEQMDNFAHSDQPWNAGQWLQWFAMDVVGELAFGQHFHLVETAKDPNELMTRSSR